MQNKSYGRSDGKGRRTKVTLWNRAVDDVAGVVARLALMTKNKLCLAHLIFRIYIEVLHLLCRCRKVAGTMQALLGGDEIYHYHSKLMMKVTLLSCNISIVKQDLGDYLQLL